SSVQVHLRALFCASMLIDVANACLSRFNGGPGSDIKATCPRSTISTCHMDDWTVVWVQQDVKNSGGCYGNFLVDHIGTNCRHTGEMDHAGQGPWWLYCHYIDWYRRCVRGWLSGLPRRYWWSRQRNQHW